MGGVCSKIERQRTYLIQTIELSKTNSETFSHEIISIMDGIYERKIYFYRLRLIFFDDASYVVKGVKILKSLFLNLKHVTCVAHIYIDCAKKLEKYTSL